MERNYQASFGHALASEGGFVNHPKDPGGATNFGVIQRTYNAWLAKKGRPPRSVRKISLAEVAEIYKMQYWDGVRADELPPGVDYFMFDYAINSGPVKAAKDLQRVLGVDVDGHIGIVTLRAVNGVNDLESLVNRLCDQRMSFLQNLKHWATFGRGWTARVNGRFKKGKLVERGVRQKAMAMIAAA